MTFKKLAEYFQKLEETSSRLKITEILADLFKEASPEEIDKIVYLSLGRLLPPFEGLEFQMAEKMMIRAVALALGLEEGAVQKEYKQLGDLGEAAEKFKQKGGGGKLQGGLFEKKKAGRELSLKEVYRRLMEIAREGGERSVERKIGRMAELIEELDALSVRYVARIPLGRLRLGFSELTIIDGLSWMLSGDKTHREEIEAAYNVLADIGGIARIVKERGLEGVKKVEPKVGTPIVSALAQRLGTVEEMLEKMGTVVLEPKYDGTRLQLHLMADGKVKIFTRNLENVTHMFPDIAEALKKEVFVKEAIFDAEGIGVDPKTGKYLPFQETIKRKRKHEIERTAKEIPFKCLVFDILYKDGQNLLSKPLFERRKVLEETFPSKPNILMISPQIITDDPGAMREFHEEQVRKGLEGAMVKKAEGAYEPGRRGFNWVKYKQEETKKGGGLADTIESVVMGIYRGKGKRATFGVGAFLVGVKKENQFVSVSKIGTGLSDEQWRELNQRSQEWLVKEKPGEYLVDKNLEPDGWLFPKIIVEIQADNITDSPIHTAGLALRFPRLMRFRDDKTVDQITTLAELKRLYQLQFGK
jgi:DNA ligase-1